MTFNPLDVRNGSGRTGLKWDLHAGAYVTWTASPSYSEREPREVHIWRVKANESNAALLASSLTEAERAQAQCFRLPASRNEFMVARGFIRFALGRYLGILPRSVRFREGQHGKPELAGQAYGDRLTFNLSHSRGVILAAITVGHEVGIDIEFFDANVRFSKIARTVFSPTEERWLSQLPDEERQLNYFRCWTRKESFVKGLGKVCRTESGRLRSCLRVERFSHESLALPLAITGWSKTWMPVIVSLRR
jgi:4'-phosphopantetheinyl transferase